MSGRRIYSIVPLVSDEIDVRIFLDDSVASTTDCIRFVLEGYC